MAGCRQFKKGKVLKTKDVNLQNQQSIQNRQVSHNKAAAGCADSEFFSCFYFISRVKQIEVVEAGLGGMWATGKAKYGVLPAPASKLAGDPVCCAQNDKAENGWWRLRGLLRGLG
jgi:hypothetical protein